MTRLTSRFLVFASRLGNHQEIRNKGAVLLLLGWAFDSGRVIIIIPLALPLLERLGRWWRCVNMERRVSSIVVA